MPRFLLMDEFHVSLHAPTGLSPKQYSAMHRALSSERFRLGLLRAVRQQVRRYPSLRTIRIMVSR